ncbi:MAG: DNA polymerase III subunit gamma/tau, partial [Gammaproteobacteria bacterium]|nr:DNA polymerase III subunit gamma/tau [Gammaproteobacteria bacterium]
MSYLVLARKWRPKNFAETAGQEHVLKALTNALDSERLHHAYLFAGTRGVGKTTIARILAKALNCETGITSSPCGECSACREIDDGRFVDLIEVDAASRTKVDDTRDLLDNVQYAPARGRFKVYLIDEVHMLSKSSFNALLKTLEEPPPHVKFLLATTDPQKLPVTVLSRCLQFNLKRIGSPVIRERLELICSAEGISAETGALTAIARAADGSLRDALSLLDQAIAFCGGNVTAGPVGEMLGTIDRQHVSKLLRLLADSDGPGTLQAIAEIDEQFPDYATLLQDLARALQKIAVYQVVGAVDAEDEIEEAEMAEFAASLSAEDVQLFYQTALLGRRDLSLAPDPRSGVEMTLLRMLAFQPAAPDRQQDRTTRGASGAPAPQTERTTSPKARPPATATAATNPASNGHGSTSEEWRDPDWSDLVEQLDLKGATRLLAGNCAYLRREGTTIHLSLDRRFESTLSKQRQAALCDALSSRFGETLRVEISQGKSVAETPMQKKARLGDEKLEAARASLEADPNVQAL